MICGRHGRQLKERVPHAVLPMSVAVPANGQCMSALRIGRTARAQNGNSPVGVVKTTGITNHLTSPTEAGWYFIKEG